MPLLRRLCTLPAVELAAASNLCELSIDCRSLYTPTALQPLTALHSLRILTLARVIDPDMLAPLSALGSLKALGLFGLVARYWEQETICCKALCALSSLR